MSRADVFLDTGVFVGAVAPRDQYHAQAMRILKAINGGTFGRVYTSDFVLAEAWNYIAVRLKRPEAAMAVRRLAFGDEGTTAVLKDILRVHSARYAAALDRYQRHFGSGLSFTDWTNLVCMDEAGITSIATFDAGFRAWASVIDGGETS